MRATDLDDALEFLGQAIKFTAELSQGREKTLVDFNNSADVHCGREAVVVFFKIIWRNVRYSFKWFVKTIDGKLNLRVVG